MNENDQTQVHCECGSVALAMRGTPRVHAFCHCDDCRELLQVPYHSVLVWLPENLTLVRGENELVTYQHPTKRMTRCFCRHCGDVLYNTNAMGWKIVSQLLFTRCNKTLPDSFTSAAHFFYDSRIVDINDSIPKR